ncbi:MAG: hypothetical protein HOH04_13560 [Rhodospirillaceae bacterium]|jgi:hypothetical protein|nr:hypothetical protein [Rhodospirillaceae bacterium]
MATGWAVEQLVENDPSSGVTTAPNANLSMYGFVHDFITRQSRQVDVGSKINKSYAITSLAPDFAVVSDSDGNYTAVDPQQVNEVHGADEIDAWSFDDGSSGDSNEQFRGQYSNSGDSILIDRMPYSV